MNEIANNHILNKGFLLARQSFDVRGKAAIVLWFSTPKGPVKLCLYEQQAVFFIEQINIHHAEKLLKSSSISFLHKPLALQTFSQHDVEGIYFNNVRDFYDAREMLKQADIEVYEGNIRLEERYLMERFIYGGVDFIGTETYEKLQ